MNKQIVYVLSLLLISFIYNYLLSFIITNYYFYNVTLTYLLLIKIDETKFFLNNKKENKNDEFGNYIDIICNQSYEIQKYKLIIENMKNKKRSRSVDDLNLL